jgi:CRP-like cAMP-binding protein
VEKGAVIYEETDRNNKLYLIESGEVTLFKGPGDAQDDVMSVLRTEKMFELRTEKMHFGESHFIHDEVLATETVTVKVDTAMGVLSVESLASVIRTIDRLDENGSLRKGKSESKQVQSSETGLSDLHRHRILGMGAFGKGKTFIFLLVVLLFCAF